MTAATEAGIALDSPFAQLQEGRLTRRLVQLGAGLVLYGVSISLMVCSGLGLDPWNALHEGVAKRTPLSFGTITIIIGVVVLLLWVPLRQWPGVGTVGNVVVVGLVVDAMLRVLGRPHALVWQIVLMVVGITLKAASTGAYIGARLGPGPRDGLMTGFCRITGRSVRLVRTTIELSVLAIGWLLGGTVGVGTVLCALATGPLVHVFLPRFAVVGGRR